MTEHLQCAGPVQPSRLGLGSRAAAALIGAVALVASAAPAAVAAVAGTKPAGLDKGSPSALRGPGILVANCYGLGAGSGWLQMELLDPANGAVTAAHYFPGLSCPDEGYQLNFLEQFDRSFRYQVAGVTRSDGGNDIGYKDLSTGKLTDVSRTEPPASGFSAGVTNDTRGAFSPTSETFWWQTAGNVLYSEPVGGTHPTSHGKVVERMYGSDNNQFQLAPVSGLPIRQGTVTTPNGRAGVVAGKAVPQGTGYFGSGITYFQGPDMLTEAKGSYWAWANDCTPLAWVDAGQLLCTTVEQKPYVLDVAAPHRQFDLLPANSRTNSFFVSNGHGGVAFMSQLGQGRPELYRISATKPGAQPVLVSRLPAVTSFGEKVDVVLSWVP